MDEMEQRRREEEEEDGALSSSSVPRRGRRRRGRLPQRTRGQQSQGRGRGAFRFGSGSRQQQRRKGATVAAKPRAAIAAATTPEKKQQETRTATTTQKSTLIHQGQQQHAAVTAATAAATAPRTTMAARTTTRRRQRQRQRNTQIEETTSTTAASKATATTQHTPPTTKTTIKAQTATPPPPPSLHTQKQQHRSSNSSKRKTGRSRRKHTLDRNAPTTAPPPTPAPAATAAAKVSNASPVPFTQQQQQQQQSVYAQNDRQSRRALVIAAVRAAEAATAPPPPPHAPTTTSSRTQETDTPSSAAAPPRRRTRARNKRTTTAWPQTAAVDRQQHQPRSSKNANAPGQQQQQQQRTTESKHTRRWTKNPATTISSAPSGKEQRERSTTAPTKLLRPNRRGGKYRNKQRQRRSGHARSSRNKKDHDVAVQQGHEGPAQRRLTQLTDRPATARQSNVAAAMAETTSTAANADPVAGGGALSNSSIYQRKWAHGGSRSIRFKVGGAPPQRRKRDRQPASPEKTTTTTTRNADESGRARHPTQRVHPLAVPGGKIMYANLSRTGRKSWSQDLVCQDRTIVQKLLIKNSQGSDDSLFLFGVLGGHGDYGHDVADYVQRVLPECVTAALANVDVANEGEFVARLIHATNNVSLKLIQNCGVDLSCSGCTASFGLLHGATIFSVNVGNSRCIVGRVQASGALTPMALSRDHHPGDPAERARIQAAGGRVAPVDEGLPDRLWMRDADVPGLNVSRGFGDTLASTIGFISEPEIAVHHLGSGDLLIIWGTGGLWRFVSNQDALDVVCGCLPNVTEAGARLVQLASERWDAAVPSFRSDISAVVLGFQAPGHEVLLPTRTATSVVGDTSQNGSSKHSSAALNELSEADSGVLRKTQSSPLMPSATGKDCVSGAEGKRKRSSGKLQQRRLMSPLFMFRLAAAHATILSKMRASTHVKRRRLSQSLPCSPTTPKAAHLAPMGIGDEPTKLDTSGLDRAVSLAHESYGRLNGQNDNVGDLRIDVENMENVNVVQHAPATVPVVDSNTTFRWGRDFRSRSIIRSSTEGAPSSLVNVARVSAVSSKDRTPVARPADSPVDKKSVPSPQSTLRHIAPVYGSILYTGEEPWKSTKVCQDRCVIMPELFPKNDDGSTAGKEGQPADVPFGLFGVLDGHGEYGHDVAEFVKGRLAIHLVEALEADGDNIVECICRSVDNVAEELNISDIEIDCSGSTAVFGVIHGATLYTANIGDSRCVLGRTCVPSSPATEMKGEGGELTSYVAVALSRDHKPGVPDERARIERTGGMVLAVDEDLPPRLFLPGEKVPGLAVSRSFGDSVSQTIGLISDPEIVVRDLDERDAFLIFASDGIWEFISSQDAVDVVGKHIPDVQKSAKCLGDLATKRWDKNESAYVDDISVVVVGLGEVARAWRQSQSQGHHQRGGREPDSAPPLTPLGMFTLQEPIRARTLGTSGNGDIGREKSPRLVSVPTTTPSMIADDGVRAASLRRKRAAVSPLEMFQMAVLHATILGKAGYQSRQTAKARSATNRRCRRSYSVSLPSPANSQVSENQDASQQHLLHGAAAVAAIAAGVSPSSSTSNCSPRGTLVQMSPVSSHRRPIAVSSEKGRSRNRAFTVTELSTPAGQVKMVLDTVLDEEEDVDVEAP